MKLATRSTAAAPTARTEVSRLSQSGRERQHAARWSGCLHKGFGSLHLAVRQPPREAVLDLSGRGPNTAQPELWL